LRPNGLAPPGGRRRRGAAAAAAVAIASLSVSAGISSAAGGGTSAPDPPTIKDVVCVSSCGGIRKATIGSRVQISGRNLSAVTKVLFSSGSGGYVQVEPNAVSNRTVTATVPDGATTGRPKVADSLGSTAKSPVTLTIVARSQLQSTGNFQLKDATASPHKAYYYGKRKPGVTYLFSAAAPTDVRIDVVKRGSGTVVDSWTAASQEPNTTHTVSWNGMQTGTNKPAPNGHYRFRIGPESGSMESATDAQFAYHGFKFPVRGPHTYGDGVGAPRVGHIHEGQDVLAACGTPLVAARGGRVQYKAYQAGGAGNYIVIDGKKTSHDYVFMHLKEPSPLQQGDRVHTGQKVGVVGATGDATGCHLHFEEWSGPGWYEGGHFMAAVTKHLKEWDAWS
jgi:murein DD-endopeptidase MepM/ murein hydrolase activator NlpD